MRTVCWFSAGAASAVAAIDAIVYALSPLSGEGKARVQAYIAARFPPHKFED
jgi:hypothetical protein